MEEKQEMKYKEIFAITAFVAIALFIGGFFVPPMGVIDGSVLKAGGILLAFGTVAQVPNLARRGTDVKLQHGQTSLTVNNPDVEPKETEADDE